MVRKMKTFKELRDTLSADDIKALLHKYGVEPYYENNAYIIYPTVCHNPIGKGSNKLYYYKNTKMFKCYTECHSMFDIFELIIKIEEIKGNKIGKLKALEIAGFKISSSDADELANDSIVSEITHIMEINYTEPVDLNNLNLEPIDASFMDSRYTFDMNALQCWIKEGISVNTMLYYHIAYDSIENCIIIPHYDANGNIVGIRGRFLSEDTTAKYQPIIYNGKQYKHPTGKTLYGFYQNKKAIAMAKTCIIFEAEKSVLMMDTIYDKNNISVAVCGQTITREQTQMLVDVGVANVIVAFDADYHGYTGAQQKLEEYKKKARLLQTYFNVSLIIDFHNRLGYKDSPIDKGEQLFNELMKERVFI